MRENPSTLQENTGQPLKKPSQRLSHLRTSEGMDSGRSCVLPLFPREIKPFSLEDYRNKYALRLHKGLAESILRHKHSREIFLWLEIKPLFISGVIFSHEGKYPYHKLAEFIGEGVSTIRKKIAILKRMKLLRFDRDRNLHLASYEKLREIFKHHTKRKYKLLNNGETQFTVKQVAIYENLKRQEHSLEKKIFRSELRKILEEQNLDPINSQRLSITTDCEKYFSRNFIRKFKKSVHLRMDVLRKKYENIYDRKILQLAFGFPEINPDVTLSAQGIARVIGRKARSSGTYQMRKLERLGYMYHERVYAEIADSPAIMESLYGFRSDIFSYKFPTRINRKTGEVLCGRKPVDSSRIDSRGNIRMYFRNCTNKLTLREDALFHC
jgi:hypothetical protein